MEQITSTGVQKEEGQESLHQVCWAQVDRVSEIAATIRKLESRSSVESSKLYWMYREEAYKIERDHGYSFCDLFIKPGLTKQTQQYFRIWERKMEFNWKAIYNPEKKHKSKVELESEEEMQEQEQEQEQEKEILPEGRACSRLDTCRRWQVHLSCTAGGRGGQTGAAPAGGAGQAAVL